MGKNLDRMKKATAKPAEQPAIAVPSAMVPEKSPRLDHAKIASALGGTFKPVKTTGTLKLPPDLTFAHAIVRIRESRGITQSDLAERTGLKPSAISHFESGRRRPCLANLVKLADALGCSADVLLGRK